MTGTRRRCCTCGSSPTRAALSPTTSARRRPAPRSGPCSARGDRGGGLFGRPPERRAERGNSVVVAPTRARPQRRHGVDGKRHGVGGLLVVEPPADEFGPCLVGFAL